MISGFQSREFGLGLRDLLTKEILDQINSNRRGQKYISEIDAMLVKNKIEKGDLTDDPALRFFDAGVNKDGYWTNSHLKIQLEDLYDCLSVIFPNFDFLIMLDQSSGHCKVREDGLVVSKLNVNYGGKASNMRDTTIHELGEFGVQLTVGDRQSMNFLSRRGAQFGWTILNVLHPNMILKKIQTQFVRK